MHYFSAIYGLELIALPNVSEIIVEAIERESGKLKVGEKLDTVVFFQDNLFVSSSELLRSMYLLFAAKIRSRIRHNSKIFA